ncbi:hypothetical protein V9K67_15345 [Paraflavisolibacter sp. H34]|uniref:hypothetical protein n=1 Tax=Huijunlia imazamoxiresistens TaxID=3127457 RepID=UPI0030196AFD
MLLPIDDNILVGDLQDRFNNSFPCLHLRFMANGAETGEQGGHAHFLASQTLLGSIRNQHNTGVMDIKSWYKAARVEEAFREQFGLNVQVFRQQNSHWIRGKGDRTLQELNGPVGR